MKQNTALTLSAVTNQKNPCSVVKDFPSAFNPITGEIMDETDTIEDMRTIGVSDEPL